MVEMKKLNNREDWLKNRKRIGGSDSASVIGLSPYASNIELWEIKTGLKEQDDISEKPYVKYGTLAEYHLRELFKMDYPEYEVLYEENNMWINDKYPFAHVSLDGWLIEKETGRKGIWECKTTTLLQSTQRDKWKDRLPDNYYIQILHALMVTEFDFAILKAQLKTEYDKNVFLQTKHYLIEREEVEEDIKFLAKKEREFWEYVESGKRPPLILQIP